MRAGKTIVGVTAATVGLILAGGCQLIAGVKDTLPYPADGGTSGTGGQGGGGPSTTGGGGGATICAPGSEIGCYSGPDGTKGVGICQEGKKTCRTDGSGYDACVGEVKPKAESCAAKEDENCDGYDCVQWAELFGDGADQQANAITVDTAGNIYVVGTFSGQIKTPTMTLTDAGSGDAFILKVDASGTPVWAKSFGDSSTQSVSAIALDSTGSFVVGGWSDTSFSLGGPDVAAGLFVAKFTSDGQHVWSKGLGSSGCGSPSGRIAAISTTAGNDFILGGSFCGSIDVGDGPKMSAGSEDAFVAQVRGGDGSGAKLKGGWIRTYGDSKSQEINDVVVDVTHSEILGIGDFSGTIVTGSKTLTSFDTSLDMFYVRLFPDGSDIWAASYGAAGIQVATDAVITKAGNLVIAGQFSDPFDIQGHTITAPAF